MNTEDKNQENEHSSHEHKSGLKAWLDEAVHQLENDFPLSGNETQHDIESSDETEGEETDVPHKEHLDTNFPLSGGDPDAE